VNSKVNVLYIGYLGFNNVGDEVCYEAFVQSITRWSSSVEKVIAYDIKENTGIKEMLKEETIDAVILGGGSLFQGNIFLTLAEEAMELNLPLYSYGTGIDYLTEDTLTKFMDGDVFEPSTYFDNRQIPTARIKRVVEYMTYCGIRGPLTFQFLKGLTSDLSSIEIIGDSGFIYHPESDSYILDHYLPQIQNPMVAVNWGTTFNKLFGYNEASVKDQLIESCRYLLSKGYHIVVYPMWDQDIDSCRELSKQIENNESVTFIPETCTATQIYTFLTACHFSINLKLHATILSASAATPFIQLAYRSKGFDFAHSINQGENTLFTHSTSIFKTVQEKEEEITNHYDSYTKKLNEEKDKYTRKHKWFSEKYFG